MARRVHVADNNKILSLTVHVADSKPLVVRNNSFFLEVKDNEPQLVKSLAIQTSAQC